MTDYIDHDNNKLEKGFYKASNVDELLYFTGIYDSKELPMFDRWNGSSTVLYSSLTRQLTKVNVKKVEEISKKSKQYSNWLENKLGK
jgi:hypothetical protein